MHNSSLYYQCMYAFTCQGFKFKSAAESETKAEPFIHTSLSSCLSLEFKPETTNQP